jgi:hypothetical protein
LSVGWLALFQLCVLPGYLIWVMRPSASYLV